VPPKETPQGLNSCANPAVIASISEIATCIVIAPPISMIAGPPLDTEPQRIRKLAEICRPRCRTAILSASTALSYSTRWNRQRALSNSSTCLWYTQHSPRYGCPRSNSTIAGDIPEDRCSFPDGPPGTDKGCLAGLGCNSVESAAAFPPPRVRRFRAQLWRLRPSCQACRNRLEGRQPSPAAPSRARRANEVQHPLKIRHPWFWPVRQRRMRTQCA
jgi:hypothetical protein